jgi:hypothetical protein
VIPLIPLFLSAFREVSAHATDIALVIYTVALVVWGVVFALVLRRKWGSWRHSHREDRLTPDEWMLIGLMVVGLFLGLVYMLTFLHGRPPGIHRLTEGS